MQQGYSSIPIVGATKLSQLEENLKVTDIIIPDEDMKRLDEASTISMGFPGDFYKEEGVRLNNFGGFYDRVEKRNT
jgi:diketogulonate reductase-like aldo/keto reductase